MFPGVIAGLRYIDEINDAVCEELKAQARKRAEERGRGDIVRDAQALALVYYQDRGIFSIRGNAKSVKECLNYRRRFLR